MPELPEVETMRRGVLSVEGSRIVSVARAACRRRPIAVTPGLAQFNRRVAGARIRQVDRLGKRVVLRLDRPEAIVLEPRMTGLVLLTEPPTLEHLRLRIVLGGGTAKEILYWDRRGLGSVRLLAERELKDRFGLEKLGPDALNITADELRARLAGSRRPIKVALLDQRAVAGIGNLYAAEILHLAGIHPARRCNRLRSDHWIQLYAALQEVLRLAIRYEGSTLADGTYRNALNQQGRYQNHHRVYDREGKPCVRCRQGVVRRIVQAQRATFFCPVCQPARASPPGQPR